MKLQDLGEFSMLIDYWFTKVSLVEKIRGRITSLVCYFRYIGPLSINERSLTFVFVWFLFFLCFFFVLNENFRKNEEPTK